LPLNATFSFSSQFTGNWIHAYCITMYETRLDKKHTNRRENTKKGGKNKLLT